jgi:YD repeat-containing protein
MLGNQVVESNLDKNSAGQAEAFPFVANTTGSLATIVFYLDPTSGSGPIHIGLYADNGHNHPGTLLGQGSTSSPVAGSWNQVSVSASNITAGTRYWIALFGTSATSPYFRDRQTTACHSETSSQTNLASLPTTWSTGTTWNTCYLAAYGQATSGSPVLSISPTSLNFTAIQGGTNPPAANFSVTNTGTGSLGFTVSTDQSWLSATPTGGTAPQTIQVAASVGSLSPGTYTGHVTVTATGAQNSPGQATVTFIVSQFVPPSISASVSPTPNGNGWNNSAVTVTFSCTAGSYSIQSCPAPVQVNTQGTNQVVTGSVFDTAGDTNTAKVTLNIDLASPVLSIASPANGGSFTSSPVSVSGTVSGSISGVATVTCNGANATVQNGSYSCAVPLSPGSDTIAVQAMNVAGSATTQSINESLIVPATITSFGPPSSSIGAIVTIQGSGFAQNAFSPEVTLNQAGGGTIVAPISGNTANSLSFVIPAGAASGPITVTVDGLTATSSSSLSVVSSSTFAIAASPSSATLLPGQTAIVQVSLTSTNGFTQLASLNVSGLPSGVTANFQPAQITAGGSAWLSLTAPAGQSASTSTLTISASATVQGIAQTQTATVGLNVQALTGSATFAGQVAVTGVYNTPLVGVTVSFTGTNYTGATTGCTGSTTTDAGGNFVLSGLSSSCTGSQMIQYDPSTVTSPPGKYSGVTLSYVLAAGQVTTPGIAVHLPNVANAEAFTISQNSSSNQVFTSKSIPGVTITVYAGTQFSLPDGTQPDPFPLSVLEIPYNQIPDYMPPNPTEDPVFAMSVEPFNSSSSQPIAISYPNRTNAAPGTDMPLTSLNPTMGMMQNYGTGAVSSDGTQIVPDTDPAHPGHLYGISHFDWHFALPFPRGQNNPCPGRVQCATGGDPIDLSSGLLVLRKTDIAFGGARGQVSIERIYRNGVVGTPANPNGIGPFGAGTAHNYWYFLDVTNAYQTPGVVGLVTPDGNDLPFTQQSDGTYLNTTAPSLSGAVLTLVSGTPLDGTYNLRWKTGALFQFQTFSTGGTFFVTVLASITDTNGNVTSIVHNPTSAMQITQIVDPVGRSLNFTYNGDFVTSMTDPIGRTVHYTYNSQAALATVTDVNGGTTQYGYDAKNNLTSITDARGIVYLQNTYDANGRVIKQITGDGGTTTFQYTQLNPSVSTSPVIATTVTDARGNPTTYQFNPQGYVISVTDALNEQTVYNVDPSSNLLTSFTDPLQRTTTLTYDSTQNITSVTRLSGTANAVTTSMTYDPIFSKVTSITDPLGHKTTMQYDPTTGNLLTLSNPMSNTVTLTYDNFGEIVSAQDPVGNSTSLKYSNGDLVSATDPLGRVQRRSTDAVSRPVTVTNALGQTTQMQFDALNHLVLLADPKGGRYSLNYDPNGNLSSIVDANQHTTSFSYDSMDRLIGRTDPLGHSESYQRDLNGNITQFADRRGIVTSALYDALNRIASITFGSQESIQYSYDSVNRLTQALDSLTGSISFGFDGLSRLTSEITPWGSVNYAYDAAGRRSGMTVSGQNPVSYTFDNASRLTQIVQGTSTAQFSYDSDGRRSNVTLPNGVSEQYSYDIASQLTQISYQLNATVLGNLTYGYDASGKRTSVGGSFARTGLPSALTSASYIS